MLVPGGRSSIEIRKWMLFPIRPLTAVSTIYNDDDVQYVKLQSKGNGFCCLCCVINVNGGKQVRAIGSVVIEVFHR